MRGELARSAGFNAATLRYYEARGLLDPPPRGPNGYRQYPPDTLARLRFIRDAKELGFSLEEIAQLLELHNGESGGCVDVARLAEARLADIDARLARLLAMRERLAALLRACPGGLPASECRVIGGLGNEEKHDEQT